MALNVKQQRFAQEYLVDQVATKAAQRAGYSQKTAYAQGSALLKHPEVKVEIEKGLKKLQADTEKRARDRNIITKEQWLAGQVELAFADIDNYVTVGADGKPTLIPTAQRKPGSGRLIKKLSVSAQGTVSVELHAKSHANEMIAKHFGWIKDQLEHSGGISNTSLAASDLQKIHNDPEARKLARALALRLAQRKAVGQEEGE